MPRDLEFSPFLNHRVIKLVNIHDDLYNSDRSKLCEIVNSDLISQIHFHFKLRSSFNAQPKLCSM